MEGDGFSRAVLSFKNVGFIPGEHAPDPHRSVFMLLVRVPVNMGMRMHGPSVRMPVRVDQIRAKEQLLVS